MGAIVVFLMMIFIGLSISLFAHLIIPMFSLFSFSSVTNYTVDSCTIETEKATFTAKNCKVTTKINKE